MLDTDTVRCLDTSISIPFGPALTSCRLHVAAQFELESFVRSQKGKMNSEMKKGLQRKLNRMISDEESVKEILPVISEHMKTLGMTEHEVVVMVRTSSVSQLPAIITIFTT